MSVLGGQPGDISARNFIELTYQSPVPVLASDVRINFINDVYDEANGIDYNVAIDNIKIGDVVYETEAPTTYSTGTWQPGIGVVPGFKESEFLSNDGYFQYLFEGVENTAPVATNDSYLTAAGTPLTANVLGNDSDADEGDTISVVSNTEPANGSVSISSNGAFTYTPNAGFSGTDSFDYTISDGTATASATVTITVESGSVIADGNIVELRNVFYGGSYLAHFGFNEVITSPTSNSDSQWQLIDSDGDGQFYLRNVGTGRYLDGDFGDVDTSSSTSGSGKLWRFVEINTGQYHLVNVTYNRVLDANGTYAYVAWDPGATEADDLWTISLA